MKFGFIISPNIESFNCFAQGSNVKDLQMKVLRDRITELE